MIYNFCPCWCLYKSSYILYKHTSDPRVLNKVSRPNWVTYLKHTYISVVCGYVWIQERTHKQNKTKKNVKEIEPHAQNLLKFLGPIANINGGGGDLCDHSIRESSYELQKL